MTSGRSTLVSVVVPTDSEQDAFMCVPGRERRPQTPLTVQRRARVFRDAVRYEKKIIIISLCCIIMRHDNIINKDAATVILCLQGDSKAPARYLYKKITLIFKIDGGVSQIGIY